MRRCSRTACSGVAVATLTYAYASSTAVIGPLAIEQNPGTYDLCALHAERMSAPVGWEIIRLPLDEQPIGFQFADDDLIALASAVREVGLSEPRSASSAELAGRDRGNTPLLRLVKDDDPIG